MTTPTNHPTTPAAAPATPDHELVRRLLAGGHLLDLLEIADAARTFRGPVECVEGECDHDGGDGGVCALMVPVYATAEHLERLHDATALLERIAGVAEAGRRQAPAGMLEALGEITELLAAAGVKGATS